LRSPLLWRGAGGEVKNSTNLNLTALNPNLIFYPKGNFLNAATTSFMFYGDAVSLSLKSTTCLKTFLGLGNRYRCAHNYNGAEDHQSFYTYYFINALQ